VKILFVASEAAPFAKTGGLGDVIGALPRALAARGHEILVVLPKYGSIDEKAFGLRDTGRRVEVQFPNLNAQAAVFVTAPAERLRYLLLANPYYERREIYGEAGKDYRDNHKRFALLSVAALEAAKQINFIPDAVHAHDWQAALTPLVLKRGWSGRPAPFKARTVFTIHNLAYQGLFPREAMSELELPGDLFNPDALEFYGQLCLLKAGLVFGDKLTTVSPTYAKEILQSPETGAGLDGLLRHRQSDLTGILNGADYSQWSPDIDPALPTRYSAQDLSGKAKCKAALQQELGLSVDPAAPLAAAIGRLAHQKGYDLLADGVPGLVSRGVQVALLGQGDPALEERFRAVAAQYPRQVSVTLRFDDGLAHRMEAGADLFLMPSRFEPCGLNQLYSLRYGTLPLVHAVGGLADSIKDATAAGRKPGEDGWGFRFDEETTDALLAAVDRALGLWKDAGAWQATVRRAMGLDFSWDRAAEKYEALYRGNAA
jgi:starch synthase